jgi:hypothetical protein
MGSAVLARFASALSFARAYSVRISLIVILCAAGWVRVHGLSESLVSFNNTRQLHCAIITRAVYFHAAKESSDPRRIVAEQAAERRGQLEPPIIQHVVALGYWLTGGEHFQVVRALGIAFWLAGCWFLYLLGRLLLSPIAGLITAAYFAFVPFGVVASQSFQPDPLMIMLMLASFALIARNDRKPELATALQVGVASGFAMLVKPVCGPMIVALYAALTLRRLGFWAALRSLETWLVAALLLIPSGIYYVGGIASGNRLRGQAEGSFMPEYWSQPQFWSGWRDLLLRVTGGPYVVAAAILGLILVPAGRARVALWALLAGYVAYGFAFSYHIHTHDYYHLLALPIVALALGSVFQRVYSSTPIAAKHWVSIAAVGCALALLDVTFRAVQTDAWPRTHIQGARDPGYVAIGELVKHSTRVIFLDPNKYGSELEFEGEIAGWRWPSWSDLRRARRKGQPPLDWRALLSEYMNERAEFFVITPLNELGWQRELHRYIESHHPRISDSPQYVVYDLTRSL